MSYRPNGGFSLGFRIWVSTRIEIKYAVNIALEPLTAVDPTRASLTFNQQTVGLKFPSTDVPVPVYALVSRKDIILTMKNRNA